MPSIDLYFIPMNNFYNMNNKNMPSDKEADGLYSLWKSSKPGEYIEASNNEVKSLESKGYIKKISIDTNGKSKYELTPKGKSIIVELATNEPNALLSNPKRKTYRQIKTRAKRQRQTFVKKASNDEIQLLEKNESPHDLFEDPENFNVIDIDDLLKEIGITEDQLNELKKIEKEIFEKDQSNMDFNKNMPSNNPSSRETKKVNKAANVIVRIKGFNKNV